MNLPSREKEWQLAHTGSPCRTIRLCVWLTSRSRHWTSRTAYGASGLITPFSVSLGISGTSR